MIDKEEHFGQALRRLRDARGLSVRQLADLVRMSKTKIGYLESANGRNVDPDDARALDAILGSGITLVTAASRDRIAALPRATRALLTGPNRYTDLGSTLLTAWSDPGGAEPVERRSFLQTGLIFPVLALEVTRHGMGTAMSERADTSVEEWQEIALEHGYNYMTMPPHELLEILMIDMIAIQYATAETDEDTARELRRAGALLSALTAMTVANLGQLREGRRWWRTARDLADGAGDPVVSTWVRGREVVRALYEQRPVETVIAMADEYEEMFGDAAPEALPELLGGKAQALALAGRAAEARSYLPKLEEVCAALPRTVMEQGRSVFGWSHDRLRFTQSFVHSFNGDFAKADEARRAAIELYPDTYRRGPAQIELQAAMCLAKIGDASGAARHAQDVLEGLPGADYIRPIVDLSHRVLNAIPASADRLPEVRSYREFLTATPQIRS
ncbi:helix-turn-helix domain-containing protein [Actinoplanes regularis]|uniref:Helix-turn-helix domain-containing protein n=1 Tax=Actinoplanes regularis TaxID=52697 RepID=A0A239IW28_9ACTN|nr:helix-turn-helix transcriptional regulator [Actinoplanes regularis]GIE91600.1 hypothetical protein Are01nite_80800 [Actinoplanes regularis]SNS97817.1 Helix-turn-helix domain-containing protein [Actinoplanes regularis]